MFLFLFCRPSSQLSPPSFDSLAQRLKCENQECLFIILSRRRSSFYEVGSETEMMKWDSSSPSWEDCHFPNGSTDKQMLHNFAGGISRI